MSAPIISVTGTKGKTTTVAIISDVLQRLQKNVLKVDTTGHFINGQRRSSLEDSKSTWRLVPSVCPGRYLYELHADPVLGTDSVAVLECSLGCSAGSGLGYRYHNVGVFLNVFEDHIGSSNRIQSKDDIVKAKQFVFSRLDPNDAYAVFNADDAYVCSALEALPSEIRNDAAVLMPIGIDFTYFDVDVHLNNGGTAMTVVNGTQIVIRTKGEDKLIANVADVPWAFAGNFLPSVWNLLSAAAAIYGYFHGNLPEDFRRTFEGVRLDPYGGRLTLLKSRNGATILADYAHEKKSLAQVAHLGRSLLGQGGELHGVVRMAYDRTEQLKFETGAVVGESFDKVVVYEKIDGYWRKPVEKKFTKFPQEVGETSQTVYEGAKSVNEDVVRIMREDEALEYVAKNAQSGDVVVVIVNDDIERSIEFIKEKFDAKFI